jgi:AbrB family looped-hinge helix DNA binding protein
MAALARSKLTAQGQISVPALVRKKLGVGPGSMLEWEEREDEVIVRRAGAYTSEDIRAALFGNTPPKPVSVEDMDEGIAEYMRERHARR